MDSKKRIYLIDVLRFMFAIAILLYHVPVEIIIEGHSLFTTGYLGVEFFFLLSGYMMCVTISSSNVDANIGMYAIKFTLRKFRKIVPYTIASMMMFFVMYYFISSWNFNILIQQISTHLFEGFFLGGTGLVGEDFYARPLWFVSVLFLLTPIFVYSYIKKRDFIDLISFIGPPWIYGYLIYNFGSFNVWGEAISGIPFFSGVLRGVAGLLLGVCLFNFVNEFSKVRLTKKNKVFLNMIILLLSIIISLSIVFTFAFSHGFLILSLFLLLLLVLSDKCFYSQFILINKKLCLFLGKISLPIYIMQCVAIPISSHFFKGEYQNFAYILITIILTLISFYIFESFYKAKQIRK